MRLIDADKFKQEIIAAGAMCGTPRKANALCTIVDRQSTIPACSWMPAAQPPEVKEDGCECGKG